MSLALLAKGSISIRYFVSMVFVTAPVEGAPKEACYNSMQTDWVGKVRNVVVLLERPTSCEVACGCVWRWVSLWGLVGSDGDQKGGAPELVGA